MVADAVMGGEGMIHRPMELTKNNELQLDQGWVGLGIERLLAEAKETAQATLLAQRKMLINLTKALIAHRSLGTEALRKLAHKNWVGDLPQALSTEPGNVLSCKAQFETYSQTRLSKVASKKSQTR